MLFKFEHIWTISRTFECIFGFDYFKNQFQKPERKLEFTFQNTIYFFQKIVQFWVHFFNLSYWVQQVDFNFEYKFFDSIYF